MGKLTALEKMCNPILFSSYGNIFIIYNIPLDETIFMADFSFSTVPFILLSCKDLAVFNS